MTNRIIVFSKSGCSPCSMVKNYLNDKEVDVEYIDAFEDPVLAGKFDIGSVPTTILLDGDTEVQRSIGFKPPELDDIVSKIK